MLCMESRWDPIDCHIAETRSTIPLGQYPSPNIPHIRGIVLLKNTANGTGIGVTSPAPSVDLDAFGVPVGGGGASHRMEISSALALDGLNNQTEKIAPERKEGQGCNGDLEESLQFGGLLILPGTRRGRMVIGRVPGSRMRIMATSKKGFYMLSLRYLWNSYLSAAMRGSRSGISAFPSNDVSVIVAAVVVEGILLLITE